MVSHTRRILVSAICTATLGVLSLTGCAIHLPDGQLEADRLAESIEGMPGITSLRAHGITGSFGTEGYAKITIETTPSISVVELEPILRAWRLAASNSDSHLRRELNVDVKETSCSLVVSHEVKPGQLDDSARFFPALCAAAPGQGVFLDDDWEGRSLKVRAPRGEAELPLDVEQLRALPGATTDHDFWDIYRVEYRWFTESTDNP